jgi:hypothetical protein
VRVGRRTKPSENLSGRALILKPRFSLREIATQIGKPRVVHDLVQLTAGTRLCLHLPAARLGRADGHARQRGEDVRLHGPRRCRRGRRPPGAERWALSRVTAGRWCWSTFPASPSRSTG